MKKKTVIILMTSLILTGCGNNDQMIQKEPIEANQIMSEQDETSDKITMPDQIMDQSFEVTLDGWGDVTFASFMPKENEYMNGDVRFKLFKASEEIYSFNGMSEDNCRYNETFGKVVAVAFKDYNGDKKMDIIIINEYAPQSDPNIDKRYNEVRLYTQIAEEKEFSLDSYLDEYLMKNYYNDSISSVMEGIEGYYSNYYYGFCTSKSPLEIETFAQKSKTSILNGDWTAVAAMVSYPITIRGVEYTDAERLISADIVLSQDYITALSEAECENLFANWQGIMLGDGELWIGEILDENMESEGLKITAINDAGE